MTAGHDQRFKALKAKTAGTLGTKLEPWGFQRPTHLNYITAHTPLLARGCSNGWTKPEGLTKGWLGFF